MHTQTNTAELKKYCETLLIGLITFFQINCAIKKCGIKMTRPIPTKLKISPYRFICSRNIAQYVKIKSDMPFIKLDIGAIIVFSRIG